MSIPVLSPDQPTVPSAHQVAGPWAGRVAAWLLNDPSSTHLVANSCWGLAMGAGSRCSRPNRLNRAHGEKRQKSNSGRVRPRSRRPSLSLEKPPQPALPPSGPLSPARAPLPRSFTTPRGFELGRAFGRPALRGCRARCNTNNTNANDTSNDSNSSSNSSNCTRIAAPPGRPSPHSKTPAKRYSEERLSGPGRVATGPSSSPWFRGRSLGARSGGTSLTSRPSRSRSLSRSAYTVLATAPPGVSAVYVRMHASEYLHYVHVARALGLLYTCLANVPAMPVRTKGETGCILLHGYHVYYIIV